MLILYFMIPNVLLQVRWFDQFLVRDPSTTNTVQNGIFYISSFRVFCFQMHWWDEALVWDPNTNNYIYNMVFSQDSVWKPLITVANPYDDLKELGDRNWVRKRYHFM